MSQTARAEAEDEAAGGLDTPFRIRAARVIVTSPGRNFVTLKIETNQGLYGIGDATLNGREQAVVAYLTEHVVPVLIGRDAPLPRRLLAPGTGDHAGDRGG
jgi:mannonate dehydratase